MRIEPETLLPEAGFIVPPRSGDPLCGAMDAPRRPAPATAPVAAALYAPAKSPLRSVRGRGDWILECEPTAAKQRDPTTGWTGSADPQALVRLRFSSRERALAFARRQGWQVTLYASPPPRPLQPPSSAVIWSSDEVEPDGALWAGILQSWLRAKSAGGGLGA